MGEKSSTKKEYEAKEISVLEGLEGVRKRPAMYIGSTGREGLHHLVYEVVDNSVDENLAGICNLIKITINKDGSVTVDDNGRGIPVDIHPIYKVPALELVITKLHAGGKFDKKSYAVSGGLHGVGISVVSALSKKLVAVVRRDGKIHEQEFFRGKAVTKMKVTGKYSGENTGTSITFFPDEEIFSTTNFDFSTLAMRFREIAFLNAGLKIIFTDERNDKTEEFYYSGGLIEFVKWLNRNKNVIHKPIYFKKESENLVADIAIQYNDSYKEAIYGFVNTINTTEGGTHIVGFKTALTRSINDYVQKNKLLKSGSLMGDDVREGLTAVVSVKIPEPQFEGQTKTKLGNSEVKGLIDSVVSASLTEFLEENPSIAKKIASKAIDASKARTAAKKAKELVRRKSAFGLSGLPGKLADCSSKKRDKTELMIVEGVSAGGNSKQARNREFQAILPLKGKILNVEKAAPARVLSSEEITNLITVIGTGIGDTFDIEKLRYNKVIIMSVDGESQVFVRDDKIVKMVTIGEFIDKKFSEDNGGLCDGYEKISNSELGEVLCFDIDSNKVRFSPIKSVIRHKLDESLYEITTAYGRSVKVTASHSVFVYEDGNVVLKKGSDLTKSDQLVAPKNLSLSEESLKRIDLLKVLHDSSSANEIMLWGKAVEDWYKSKVLLEYEDRHVLSDPLVRVPSPVLNLVRSLRKASNLTNVQLCESIGIKQPVTFYSWEKGETTPSLTNWKNYLSSVGADIGDIMTKVSLEPSKLEKAWSSQYKGAPRNRVRPYVSLSNLSKDDVDWFSNREDVKLAPYHYHHRAIPRFVYPTKELFMLLGFYLAEGSCTKRSGIRLAIGKNNEHLLPEITSAFKKVFDVSPQYYQSKPTCSELRVLNRVATVAWQKIFGFIDGLRSNTKKLPDIVFNAPSELRKEFLRGYLLGDGSLSNTSISYTTTSKDIASGLQYLFSSLGIFASCSAREPAINQDGPIITRSKSYTISISSRADLRKLELVWSGHKNAHKIRERLKSSWPSINRSFKDIGGDLVSLPIRSINEVKSSNGYVYDFSVERDENFIAGVGGICCHNTDADVDGQHIKTLLLTFFYRFMPKLIEKGNIFVAVAPLFKIRRKKDHYVYSEEALKRALEKLKGGHVTRFKGLGEMNPQQLWETTMDPKARTLKKIMVEDAVSADEIFTILMGDKVEPRKQFIAEHSTEAVLDI